MSKEREALKLALELFEAGHNTVYGTSQAARVIAAIKEALAEQPTVKDCLTVEHKEEKPMHPEIRKMWEAYFDKCFAVFAEDHKKFLAQPAQQQEPVAWINWCAATGQRSVSFECESELASEPLYAGITQNTQRHYSKFHSWFDSELHRQKYTKDHPAYLAAQEAWNAANDDAQHRINRLSAEIEAWKARFKIAEDALAKLNGMEGNPLTFDGMTAQEFALKELYAFQEATGCDTADQIKAREPLKPEQFNHMLELFVVPPHHVEMVVRAIEAAHGIGEKK